MPTSAWGGMQELTNKTPVVSLVHVETAEVGSTLVVKVASEMLRRAVREQTNVAETMLHTLTASAYGTFAFERAGRQRVNRKGGECVRDGVSTNKAENYFSKLKLTIDRTQHQVRREHLHRYLAEFDFQHSSRQLTGSERVIYLMGKMNSRWLIYSGSR